MRKIKSTSYSTRTSPSGLCTNVLTYLNGKEVASSYAFPAVARRFGEEGTIIYYTGRDGGFRPCSHTRKVWSIVSDSDPNTYKVGNSTTFAHSVAQKVQSQGHSRSYSQFVTRGNSLSVSIASVNWDALAIDALRVMLPAVSSGNNLTNFLLELKDFKRIYQLVLRRSVSWIGLLKAASGWDNSRPFATNVASTHLAYQFAWKPLWRDIKDLYKALVTLHAKLDDILRRANVPQQRYYGTDIPGSSAESILYTEVRFPSLSGATYMQPACDTRVRRVPKERLGRYSATVRYRYPLPSELTTQVGRLRALKDSLGLNANIHTMWNALPFTFIVDWFVDVSGFLEGLVVDEIPLQIEILGFSHSVKAEEAIVYECRTRHYGNSSSWVWNPWEVTDTCVARVYERRIGLPNFLRAAELSGLNTRQMLLSTSLLAVWTGGRRPRRKQRTTPRTRR